MTTADSQSSLREHLLELLDGGAAHLGFEEAVAGLGPELQGVRPVPLSHSAWELLEHLRICQWDILRFSIDSDHVSPKFPDGYWPDSPTPPDELAWDRSLAAFRRDLQAMRDLIANPANDLLEPFRWGDGQTLAREAMLLADHNAYHLGQLIQLRRVLNAWPPESESHNA